MLHVRGERDSILPIVTMSVRRALLYSYIEKYGSYVIALLSTAVISRLLGPGDIGAFAVGMALVGMVAVIREFEMCIRDRS